MSEQLESRLTKNTPLTAKVFMPYVLTLRRMRRQLKQASMDMDFPEMARLNSELMSLVAFESKGLSSSQSRECWLHELEKTLSLYKLVMNLLPSQKSYF